MRLLTSKGPSRAVSDEGLARRAVSVRVEADRELAGSIVPLVPGKPIASARNDPRPYLEARAEGAEAVLFSEVAVLSQIGDARRAYLRFLSAATPELLSVAPSHLSRRLRSEHDGIRRTGLVAGVARAEARERRVALGLVESLREASGALASSALAPSEVDAARDREDGAPSEAPGVIDAGASWQGLLRRVGWVTRDPKETAERVLSLTDDAYRELLGWRTRLVHGRSAHELTMADHVALTRAERADAWLPLPDREGIASRWCGRIGLGLPTVAGGVPAPELAAPSPMLLAGDPDVRPRIFGAPAPDTQGVLELLQLVGILAAARGSGQGPIAHALGTTRLHGAIAGTVARRLLMSGPFAMREAGLDRSQLDVVFRELLFVELDALRTAAAQTLALHFAFEREPGLGERIAQTYVRALAAPIDPALAPFRVCEAWHHQAPLWLEAALVAPVLESALESELDEDWFRNPRAGQRFSAAIDAMRALGPAGVLEERTPPDVDRAFSLRLLQWFRAAKA